MTEQQSQQDMVVQELTGRIGQIVSQYEEQLAKVKAEAITLLNERDAKIAELENVQTQEAE